MRRSIPKLLVLSFIFGCGQTQPPTSTTTTPDTRTSPDVTDASSDLPYTPASTDQSTECAALAALDPTLELGTGEHSFEAITGPLEVVAGPQGGWHVYGSLRTQGIKAAQADRLDHEGTHRVSFQLSADGHIFAGYAVLPRPMEEHALGVQQLTGELLVLYVDDPTPFLDREVTMLASVLDGCGVQVSAQQVVELVPGWDLPETDSVTETTTDTDSVASDTDLQAVDTDDSGLPAPDTDDVPTPAYVSVNASVSVTIPGAFVAMDAAVTSHVLGPGDRLASPPVRPEHTAAFLADLDRDGRSELIVSGMLMPGASYTHSFVMSYDPITATWGEDAMWTAQLPPFGVIQVAADFDRDGHIDLFDARGRQPLYGDGAGGFQPGQGLTGIPSQGMQLADIDNDGLIDAVAGSTSCQSTSWMAFHNTGARTFESIAIGGPVNPSSAGYGALAAPLGPDRIVFLLLNTHCNANAPTEAFVHSVGWDADGMPSFEWFDPTPTDALYKQSPAIAGGSISGSNPMAALVTDLDNDLTPDLVVVTANARLDIFEVGPAWPMIDRTATWDLHHDWIPGSTNSNGGYELGWGSAAIDLDLDGDNELVISHGDDFSSWRANNLGPQGIQVFWNIAPGTFAENRDAVGLTMRGSYRAMSVGDLDSDGDADLVLGGREVEPTVLRNDLAPVDSHGFSLRLQGTTSNPAGLGARVVVHTTGTLAPHLEIMGGHTTPSVMSDALLFFGLGAATEAERVEITWPSGLVQHVHGLVHGQLHTITEPPLVTLSEADRHLPADGTSLMTIEVTPRDTAGTLRAASVAITAAAGPADWVGEATQDGLVWRRTLRAPTASASTVVLVTIDGQEVLTRPRVWWD